MAGVHFEIDVREITILNARLERLGKVEKTGLLHALGAEVESQTRRRIGEEKESPEGEAWQAWSPADAQTRHAGGHHATGGHQSTGRG